MYSYPSLGSPFHCLQATSHALQPIHSEVSVKKPFGRRVRSRRVMSLTGMNALVTEGSGVRDPGAGRIAPFPVSVPDP